MNTVRRFVGGSQHGQIRALQHRTQYIAVPVYRGHSVFEGERTRPEASVGYSEERYREERIGLGMQTFAVVMVLDTMTEDEKWRRIADLIEGCGADSRR